MAAASSYAAERRRPRYNRLAALRAGGFDRSTYDGGGHWRVKCSQCEALVINGYPTHERGCPNRPRYEENPLGGLAIAAIAALVIGGGVAAAVALSGGGTTPAAAKPYVLTQGHSYAMTVQCAAPTSAPSVAPVAGLTANVSSSQLTPSSYQIKFDYVGPTGPSTFLAPTGCTESYQDLGVTAGGGGGAPPGSGGCPAPDAAHFLVGGVGNLGSYPVGAYISLMNPGCTAWDTLTSDNPGVFLAGPYGGSPAGGAGTAISAGTANLSGSYTDASGASVSVGPTAITVGASTPVFNCPPVDETHFLVGDTSGQNVPCQVGDSVALMNPACLPWDSLTSDNPAVFSADQPSGTGSAFAPGTVNISGSYTDPVAGSVAVGPTPITIAGPAYTPGHLLLAANGAPVNYYPSTVPLTLVFHYPSGRGLMAGPGYSGVKLVSGNAVVNPDWSVTVPDASPSVLTVDWSPDDGSTDIITTINLFPGSPGCPAGQTYNPNTGFCEPIVCPPGQTFNTATGVCEGQCPTGYHWDDTVAGCVQNAGPTGPQVSALTLPQSIQAVPGSTVMVFNLPTTSTFTGTRANWTYDLPYDPISGDQVNLGGIDAQADTMSFVYPGGGSDGGGVAIPFTDLANNPLGILTVTDA